jgi:hypothetical protein
MLKASEDWDSIIRFAIDQIRHSPIPLFVNHLYQDHQQTRIVLSVLEVAR